MLLADKIVTLRKRAGWSQEELAAQLGVSRQSVSKWEGAQSVPDMQKVVQMSRLFGVTTDYLLKEELGEPEPAPAEPDALLRCVTMEQAADYLAQRLPVEEIGIAPLLSLEDYYRTDPHWRQERLHPVAQALADAMGVSLPDTAEESLHTLAGEFHGSYWGKTAEPLAADVLSYITSPLLDGCAVYDYETDSTGGVYDLTAAEKAPYDLFLSGSKALLRIENPAAGNDRTLIVFRDSFGSSLIPLLAQGYGTVYAVDIRYLATDALARVVTFPEEADVLLVYSATVLQNSVTLK